MEIVQVAGLFPPHLGGEELVAQQLATMQARRHNVTVYTSDIDARTMPRRQQDGRLQVFRDRAWRVGNTPVLPRLTGRLLRHEPRPDVVHVHVGQALLPEMVRFGAGWRGVPYVAHVHLMVRPSSTAGRLLLPLYQRTLYAHFLRRAALVICLTEAMRRTVVARFGLNPERVAVVPNGVDGEVFTPGPFAGRAPRELLIAGRLTAQKNVAAAVGAMAHLPRDVTLRVVGDGEDGAALRAQVARLGLTGVRFEGRLAPAELAAAYQRATLVLMPSTHEGQPLVLLEAMATGAPVVCSALPELVETAGDAALPVEEPTPAALGAAIRALLDDPARRRRMADAALRRAATYTWPAVASAVDELYDRVRAGRG
ncbi:glycosyltransferase family 4 protein [Actinoplanes sp. GCM10030250]|uniref:glycosyltransferase family 4 protein n=1 Tax=Actinoplanes sp. GCM10030250 TaxID=3273376 RepID=UPI003616E94F